MKMMPRDRARAQTEKKLDNIEKEIGGVYQKNPALLSVQKEYAKYMAMVKKRTEDAYKAFVDESDKDIKAEKKEAYMGEIRRYTLESAEYKKLVKKIVGILAQVNQEALEISNKAMRDVYAINYNQVAEDCEAVGIKVNGKE